MDDNEDCKVILIGESGVGKTCIIIRFINKQFKDDTFSTSSSSYASKVLELEGYDKPLHFQIWDTAGQEQYRGLTKMFYKEAKIVILVYDITNRKSFDEIKNYWYEQIKENSSKSISKFFIYIFFIFKYLELLGISVIGLSKKLLVRMKGENLLKALELFSI